MKEKSKDYPLISLSKADFKLEINLPKRPFPPTFTRQNKDYYLGGYFTSYNFIITFDEVAKNLLARNWQFFSQIIGDFLLIFCDFKTRQLHVLTDQTGRFPCYFSVEDENLKLSTHFAEVKNGLRSKTLDIETSLDLISGNFVGSVTDRTILAEVKQIPPGCLFSIDGYFKYSITSLVRLPEFFGAKIKEYSSVEKFADDFVLVLEQLIKDRLNRVGNLKIAADLSSGFDCALICFLLKRLLKGNFKAFASVSKFALEDTVPRILMEFARKHELNLQSINVDQFYPFSSKFYLDWIANNFYPAVHALELEYVADRAKAKDGYLIGFHGSGGDEIYRSYLLEDSAPFAIQNEYFHTIENIKDYHLAALFTKKGQELLTDKRRFMKRKFYPLFISPTAVLVETLYFPLYWEAGIWPMGPYVDPRLVQFARGLPKVRARPLSKLDIWRHRGDIFVKEQFRPKGRPVLADRYLIEEKSFIIKICKNSLLTEKGIINGSQIVNDIQNNRSIKYQKGGVSWFLQQLLHLEYFIQQNNIKVPDY